MNDREDKVMKIVNKPYGTQQFGGAQHYGAQQASAQQYGAQSGGSRDEVSETDVYLLSAIEKMAYRLDLMEKRLRRTEDLLHYVMVEQNSHKQPGDSKSSFTFQLHVVLCTSTKSCSFERRLFA